MRSSLNSDKVDSSEHPRVTCLPCAFIRDRGSHKTLVSLVGAQNNCAWVKIWLDFWLEYPRWYISDGKIMYSPVLLRRSLVHWWEHFFSDPNYPKIHPHLHKYSSVRVHPYLHPQHIKVLNHFVYIWYGCGMPSEAVCSLNHDTTTTFGLTHTPTFQKIIPTCTGMTV